jgi:hypothetical protein
MHKNVLSSLNGNKTKSLLVIKPLDRSCWHTTFLLLLLATQKYNIKKSYKVVTL